MAIKPFIIKTAELLDKENITLSPLSGLDALGIELPEFMNRSDVGSIWIEGLEGSNNGRVVIRLQSETIELHCLPEVAKTLAEKALTVLEGDSDYNMNMKTMAFQPDASEPDDAPVRYSIELRIEKRASSPEEAVREMKKILNRPPEFLESLLKKEG